MLDTEISQSKKSKRMIIFIVSGIMITFLGVGILLANILLSDDAQRRQRRIQTITVVKPPPPPKIKEKPPEPEIEKKEEIIEPEPEEPQPEEQMSEALQDNDLGLDADGTGGADGFGLKAKKGGTSLIGSAGSQYAWYHGLIINEIQKIVNKRIQENGGIPDKNLRTMVRIVVDEVGNIVDFQIINPSGNQKLDETVREAVMMAQINEPPPVGMPRALKFKIYPQG